MKMHFNGFKFRHLMALSILLSGLSAPLLAQPTPAPPVRPKPPKPVASKPLEQRGLQIAVASDAPAPVRAAAEKILAALPQNALLQFMAGNNAPTALSDSTKLASGPIEGRAFDHLVVVGLTSDPLVNAAWSREAKFDGQDAYIFGFGYLRGDIGFVESDRNPFLHSRFVEKNLYEAEIMLITGTTPRGVELAADAFIKGLVNGVVAAPGWSRPRENLLQRDPLSPDWTPPTTFPVQLGDWKLAGFTQANEDEYRGVESRAKIAPRQIWRAKYVANGVWDGVGGEKSFENYQAGLHRRASGNSLWSAQWESPEQAKNVFAGVVGDAGIRPSAPRSSYWKGAQPAYANRTDSMGDLGAWTRGDSTWMSTLPAAVTLQLGPEKSD